MPDLEYISRRLNTKALEAFKLEFATMIRRAAASNGLQNSRTYLQVEDIALRVFTKQALDAAQFTFNSSEGTGVEVTNALKYCMDRMVDMIGQELNMPNGLANSAHSDTYVTIVDRTKVKLAEKRERRANNSPGAVQQVGSNFNQTAFNQNHQSLVQEIEKALASPQFAALKPEDQVSVRDIADVVKEEAKKSEPDAGKLKRWGERLVKISEDMGLKVVSSTVAALLVKMYTGS